MKLWLLRPIKGLSDDPWKPWYDKHHGFVIRAKNEESARVMANANSRDENFGRGEVWTNPKYSTCIELTKTGKSEIIMIDSRSA